MSTKHPPHLLENKALLVEQLSDLLDTCRNGATGLGPVELASFSNVLLQLFGMGHRSRAYVLHHFRKKTNIADIWPTLIEIIHAGDIDDTLDSNASEQVLINHDILDSREDRYFRRWISDSIKKKGLSDAIKQFADNSSVVDRHYHPFSFFSVAKDCEHILRLIKGFEDLPFRRPEKMKWNESWSIVIAKNNVMAMCIPPEGVVAETESDSEEGSASTDTVESGYFAVLERDSIQEEQPSPVTSDVSLPHGGDTSTQAPGCKEYRMVWTPNNHFLCVNQSGDAENDADARAESPLPSGWDMAYDPITGATYYIDHSNMQTTWTRPSSSDNLPPSERSAPGWCRCGSSERAISVDNSVGHRCSIVSSMLPGLGTKVYAKKDNSKDDAGHLLVLSRDNIGERTDLLLLPRGFSNFVAELQELDGCDISMVLQDPPRDEHVYDDTPLSPQDLVSRHTSVGSLQHEPMVFGLHEEAESAYVTMATWKSFLDEKGRHTDWDAFRKLVFFRGLDPDARKAIWPFLLGVYPPYSTYEERAEILSDLSNKYFKSKFAWNLVPVQDSQKMRKKIRDIYKDTVRTDRELPYYAEDDNPHLAMLTDILITTCLENESVPYVQGMSDILAPMLMILDDEIIAYMSFKSNLVRLLPYFDGGPGMSALLEDMRVLTEYFFPDFYGKLCEQDMINMFFCYRWMLLDFRREFDLQDVLQIWETIWCRHRSDKFHVFVALAIMKVHNPYIEKERDGSTSPRDPNMLEYYANLAGKMDITNILIVARSILYEVRLETLPEPIERIGITNDQPVKAHIAEKAISGGDSSLQQISKKVQTGLDKTKQELPLIDNQIGDFVVVEDVVTLPSRVGSYGLVSEASASSQREKCDVSPETVIGPALTSQPTAIPTSIVATHTSQDLNSPLMSQSLLTPAKVASGSPPIVRDEEGTPPPLEAPKSNVASGAVFTPELLAATPASIIDCCRTAIQFDAAAKWDEALECYMSAIDDLLAVIKPLPKQDPGSKVMKKFVKFLLNRADELKEHLH